MKLLLLLLVLLLYIHREQKKEIKKLTASLAHFIILLIIIVNEKINIREVIILIKTQKDKKSNRTSTPWKEYVSYKII